MERYRWAIIAAYGVVIGTLSHIFQASTCTHQLGNGGGPPDAGSPAAHYCAIVWHGYDWPAFAAAGALLAVLVYFALRPRALAVRGLCSVGLVLVVAIANAAYGAGLRGYVPSAQISIAQHQALRIVGPTAERQTASLPLRLRGAEPWRPVLRRRWPKRPR